MSELDRLKSKTKTQMSTVSNKRSEIVKRNGKSTKGIKKVATITTEYKHALGLSMQATTPDPRYAYHRGDIKTFAANPKTKIYIGHQVIEDAGDLFLQAIDSGDFDYDPTLKSALFEMAKSPTKATYAKMSDKAKFAFDRAVKVNARLATAWVYVEKGIQGTVTNATFDATDCVYEWDVDRDAMSNAGSANVQMFDGLHVSEIAIGDKLYIHIEGQCIYWGKIMSIQRQGEYKMTFKIVDPIWYLKNAITWVQPEKMKLSDAIVTLCALAGVGCRTDTIPDTLFKCPARVEEHKSAWDIIQSMLTETLYAADKQFVVRMSPAMIELVDLDGEKGEDGRLHQRLTAYDLCDAVTDFTTEESVLENTYNAISLFARVTTHTKADGQSGKKAHTFTKLTLFEEQELLRIQQYGMIKYTESQNNAIITEDAIDGMLAVMKYPTRDLNVELVGLINIMPGDAVRICGSVYLVQKVNQIYDGSAYKMTLNMARWQKPIGDSWDFTYEWRQEREQNEKAIQLPDANVIAARGIENLKSTGDLKYAKYERR